MWMAILFGELTVSGFLWISWSTPKKHQQQASGSTCKLARDLTCCNLCRVWNFGPSPSSPSRFESLFVGLSVCICIYIYNIIPGPSKSWRFVVSLGVGCFSCETRRNLTKILHQNYSKSAVASAGLADSLWQVAFAAVFFARPTLPKLSQPKTTNFTRKNPPKSVTAKNIKNRKSGKVVEWHHWK